MFSENLKTLRKQKGMSQEVLAQQLHVVRQTISKWEKGLSVPDAEMLVKIAEIFEIFVSELLGEKIEETKDMNEIAIQLALLNEQLANKSRRNKRILKTILITIVVVVLVCFLFTFAGIVLYKYVDDTGELTTVDLTCTLDDKEYYYSITYDEQYNVIEAGGDQWVADHVYVKQYSDAQILIAQIEDYFDSRGGEVVISE
ncbi:MAG: helix-turn-helix domain-containing protein [Erysipelotrichaceae bacterium]|nr:helix-turn-helix domain-containing protein [Erysipelotrichaceae bacterium]